MLNQSLARPLSPFFPGGYAPTPFASAMSLPPPPPPPPPPRYVGSRLEAQLRGYVPTPVLPPPIPPARTLLQLRWSGQEVASPLPSPRSVHWSETAPGEHPMQRQDRNEWLWSRRPCLVFRYRSLRRTRSCPERCLGWHHDRS
jgi:hypothetical protein